MNEREALAELVACCTEPAGWTTAMMSDRVAFEETLDRSTARMNAAVAAAREALAQPAVQGEPVAWRDHVEQRLLTWKQRTMNKSGDMLALDDFMDKESLNDLIDFVCDEYAHPPSQPPREPLADNEIIDLWDGSDTFVPAYQVVAFARAVLAAAQEPKT